MDNLIEFIKKIANIAYIEDGDTVIDGCFALTPYLTSGLMGDGEAQTIVNYYSIEAFFVSKIEAMSAAKLLWTELLKNKYFAESPDYTFERDAGFWKATIRVKQMEE